MLLTRHTKKIKDNIAVVTQFKASLGPRRKTTFRNPSRDQHGHIPAQTQGCEVQAWLGKAGARPQHGATCATPAQHSTAQLGVAGTLGTVAYPEGSFWAGWLSEQNHQHTHRSITKLQRSLVPKGLCRKTVGNRRHNF